MDSTQIHTGQIVSERENGRVDWPRSVAGKVVHIAANDLVDAPMVEPAPRLILGSGDFGLNDQFAGINGIALDSANRIYVFDVVAYRVRVFSPTGQFIRDIGKRGGGPGEFLSPHGARKREAHNGIAISHDTLFVLDQKIHAFDTAGIFIQSSRSELPFYNTNFVAATKAGLTFQFSLSRDPRISSYDLVTADFVHGDAVVDSIRIDQLFYDYKDGWKVPLLPRSTLQYHVASNGHVYFAVGDSFHVDIRELNGTLLTSIVAHPERVPVAAGDIDDLRNSQLQSTRLAYSELSNADFERHWGEATRKRFAGRAVAKFRPAIGGIIAASSGTFIVSRPDVTERPYRFYSPGDRSEWTLIDKKGAVLARVKLPTSFSPKVFEDCLLYGLDEDEDGTPLMVQYDLAGSGCQ